MSPTASGGSSAKPWADTALCDGVVALRPITEADTDSIVRWRNAPHVQGRFLWRETLTPAAHEAWLRGPVAAGRVHQFIIEAPAGGAGDEKAPVGSVFLRDVDLEARQAEFGIFIGEPQQLGKGYGTRATALILRYGFERLGLDSITLRVLAGNTAAIASYKKCGFAEDPGAPPATGPNGEPVLFMRASRPTIP